MAGCQQRHASDDQGKTSACWIYAMLTCIEHEAMQRGDSVALSRQWLMAKTLEEQTQERYLIRQQTGKVTPSPLNKGGISLRGVGPEVLRLIAHYGLIPYQNEKTEIINSSVLERKLALLADQAQSLSELRQRTEELMPQFTVAKRPILSAAKEKSAQNEISNIGFYYLSQRYNPYQFAESVMYYQRWHFFTSVKYRPYDEPFVLEVPDNHRSHEYMNIPMPRLTNMVLRSLRQGHAVYWEYGKPTKDGGMTSQHAMAIVGIKQPKDNHGDIRLVCKNSYGKDWGNKGYCIVTLKEFQEKTCNVGIFSE